MMPVVSYGKTSEQRFLRVCLALVLVTSLILGATAPVIGAQEVSTDKPWWGKLGDIIKGAFKKLTEIREAIEQDIIKETGEAQARTLGEYKAEVTTFIRRTNVILRCLEVLVNLSPEDVRELQEEAVKVQQGANNLNIEIVLGSSDKIRASISNVDERLAALEVSLWEIIADTIDRNRKEFLRKFKDLEGNVDSLTEEVSALGGSAMLSREDVGLKNEQQNEKIENLVEGVDWLTSTVGQQARIVAEQDGQIESLQKKVLTLGEDIAKELGLITAELQQNTDSKDMISGLQQQVEDLEEMCESLGTRLEQLERANHQQNRTIEQLGAEMASFRATSAEKGRPKTTIGVIALLLVIGAIVAVSQ